MVVKWRLHAVLIHGFPLWIITNVSHCITSCPADTFGWAVSQQQAVSPHPSHRSIPKGRHLRIFWPRERTLSRDPNNYICLGFFFICSLQADIYLYYMSTGTISSCLLGQHCLTLGCMFWPRRAARTISDNPAHASHRRPPWANKRRWAERRADQSQLSKSERGGGYTISRYPRWNLPVLIFSSLGNGHSRAILFWFNV